jgi:hypothetical protein
MIRLSEPSRKKHDGQHRLLPSSQFRLKSVEVEWTNRERRRMLRGQAKPLQVALPIAVAAALFTWDATAQTSSPEVVARAANETKLSEKAGPPHDPNMLGIVTDFRNDTEMAAANEVAALITAGQETGPHGE